MTILYLAGPLFTLAERDFNANLSSSILEKRPDLTIILPQDEGLKFKDCDNKNEKIFVDCIASVDRADIVVAILEGSDADSGTCVELGYAHGRGKAILGIRTDFRVSEESGLNLMLPFACQELYLNTSASLDDIVDKIIDFVDRFKQWSCQQLSGC